MVFCTIIEFFLQFREDLLVVYRDKSVNFNYSIFVQESEAPQGLGGAMISAVKRGCVEAVSQLLLQGAPLNVKDSVRHSLIHFTNISY